MIDVGVVRKVRVRRLRLLACATVLFSMLLPLGVAFATDQYTLSGCRFHTSGNDLRWKDNTTRPGYSSPAVSSVGAWNSATTHLTMALVTSGANLDVQDGNYGPLIQGRTWDGVTFTSCVLGEFTATSHSWWNRYYTDAYSVAKRQSVMTHELGHGLGLGHYTAHTCPNVQIMETGTYMRYDVCGYTTPQSGDVNGINALY